MELLTCSIASTMLLALASFLKEKGDREEGEDMMREEGDGGKTAQCPETFYTPKEINTTKQKNQINAKKVT